MARIKKAPDLKTTNKEVVEKPTPTVATVYSHNGGHFRTYSREIHGENFEDLAKEFAAQHHGSRIEVR